MVKPLYKSINYRWIVAGNVQKVKALLMTKEMLQNEMTKAIYEEAEATERKFKMLLMPKGKQAKHVNSNISYVNRYIIKEHVKLLPPPTLILLGYENGLFPLRY